MSATADTRSLTLRPWSELSAEERAGVRGLTISAAQIEYAGTIEAAIAHCEANDEGELTGLAILAPTGIAGFLLLKRGRAAPDWVPDSAAAITALRVDTGHQGRGVGTAALQLVPAWVGSNWRRVDSVVLSVDEENAAAIRSYRKAGWSDDGVRIRGRIGWERRMTRKLERPPAS